ncbi:uncharacterized protein ColSpa_01282 [Colletotrichum spaethianum]|uniref:Uncharacterized protein n=1 Tax=Colletotrichum spaethianum TaxID=700344 RepID=A0AA37L3K3_9PEZI|nr:uncharacterized protein ColSpa_01282 [Colletotrichum spaethianum]GKT41101.1 hypothetical protein ColSpa_01282 [Colletotrichum spaethianum]
MARKAEHQGGTVLVLPFFGATREGDDAENALSRPTADMTPVCLRVAVTSNYRDECATTNDRALA